MPRTSDRRRPSAGPDPVRVFLDADVLFAGSASTTGASHLVLLLSELGIIAAFTSTQCREEVERNLTVKLPATLPAFRAIVAAACHPATEPSVAAVRHLVAARAADPKDAPILAAALATACPWLLTFNTRDYQAADRIRVAEPGAFVSALRARLADLADT